MLNNFKINLQKQQKTTASWISYGWTKAQIKELTRLRLAFVNEF